VAAGRWEQVEAIVQSALDIGPGEARARFLTEACAGDEGLRREVERLLAAADAGATFIHSPARGAGEQPDPAARERAGGTLERQIEMARAYGWGDAFVGRRVGAFELKREIGRGGMGAVYLAERTDGEFRQQVAVKLIKRGMDTDFVVKRFRHERQILAALDHPHIARLLGGGTTDTGLPYFVMEYVEGEPLYRFCDGRRMTTHARLRLFREICDAVEAAHQIRVVHRDLKPSNILIRADGTPKLLDFGIAKILDPELAAATLEPTATAMRLMTPEYASPEQVCGDPVSRASDIYSLGVMLYELLTGRRPHRFRNRALHEIHRAVCEEVPAAPSESLTREDNHLQTRAAERTTGESTTLRFVCEARGTDFENLRRELSGDLDKIVLKALRKNPAERYQSAAELSADIGRYLESRPVEAEAFAAGAADEYATNASASADDRRESVAILPFKLFGTTGGAGATDSDEFLGIGLADALVTRLSSVPRLVVRPTSSVLGFAPDDDPFAAGRRLGVKFVVDGNVRRARERIRVTVQLLNVGAGGVVWAQTFDERFTDVLTLEDSISERVAGSLAPHLTGEEERRLQKRGTDDAAAYEAYLRGRFYWNQFTPDSLAKALQAFGRATEIDPHYALAHVGIADIYIWANIYGTVSSSVLDEAERAARRAVEIDPRLGEAYASLGLIYQNRKRWEEAERLQRRALKLSPNYVHAHEWMAAQLVGLGSFDEGVAEMKIAERLDPLSLRTKTLAAWTLYQAGRYDEALARAEEIIELDENYPQGYLQRGNVLLALGDTARALDALRRFDRMIPDFALAKFPLCFALVRAGRREEAEVVLGELKSLAARGYVKSFFLAMGYAALGRRDEAFRHFERALAEDEPWLLWFGTDPMIRTLSDDPRFVGLLERMNNPLAREFKRRAARPNGQTALAVLPFKALQLNTGERAEDEFLSIGLTDTLITRLSRLRSIVVRPTSAVVRFAESADAPGAGRELEADYVLSGTIRRAGDRVRLSAQLLDAADNSVGWAEVFDERASDVLALEDSIAERVTASLAPHLTGEERRALCRRGTDSAEAHEAYLKGRFYFFLMNEAGFRKAIDSYERAVALDPRYALAHAAVAEYYIFLAVQCVIPFAEAARRAKEAAERAASIDSQLAEVQTALGFVAINHDLDWATAERHTRRALELNPNSFPVVQWAKTLYLQTGRFEEAFRYARRLGEIAPDSMMAVHFLAWTEHCARRFDDSLASHERLIASEPHYAHARVTYSWTLRCVGRHGEAVGQARRGVELAPGNPMYQTALAAALADAGEIDEALGVLALLERAAAARYVSPYMLAHVHTALRDRTRAFDELERALDIRDVWLVFAGVEPLFDPLRGDPRFAELLRRMRHPLAP
jgi:eukaryotic-like serine/threonine-protein kinase